MRLLKFVGPLMIVTILLGLFICPSYTLISLITIALLVVCAALVRAVGIVSIFFWIAVTAVVIWIGLNAQSRNDVLQLSGVGIAAPVLLIYFLFRFFKPLSPQALSQVYIRDASTKFRAHHIGQANCYAGTFYQYAVLSQAAYDDGPNAEKFVKERCPQWCLIREKSPGKKIFRLGGKAPTEEVSVSGLHYQIWYNESDGAYAVAFRGTRFRSGSDWIANAHWFHPLRDHYTDIDDALKDCIHQVIIRHKANLESCRREADPEHENALDYELICTGHSLGGGLARQLAYSYLDPQCRKIVVYAFDGSTVDDWHTLREETAYKSNNEKLRVHEIFERGEILGLLRLVKAGIGYPPPDFASYYRFNYSTLKNPIKSHNMLDLANALREIRNAEPYTTLISEEAERLVAESESVNKVRANVSTRNISRAAKNDCCVISTTYRKKKANVSTPAECRVNKREIQPT